MIDNNNIINKAEVIEKAKGETKNVKLDKIGTREKYILSVSEEEGEIIEKLIKQKKLKNVYNLFMYLLNYFLDNKNYLEQLNRKVDRLLDKKTKEEKKVSLNFLSSVKSLDKHQYNTRLNKEVLEKWEIFIEQNKGFKSNDLMSEALNEYMKNHS